MHRPGFELLRDGPISYPFLPPNLEEAGNLAVTAHLKRCRARHINTHAMPAPEELSEGPVQSTGVKSAACAQTLLCQGWLGAVAEGVLTTAHHSSPLEFRRGQITLTLVMMTAVT